MKAKDIAQVIEKVANAEQEFNEAKAKAEALMKETTEAAYNLLTTKIEKMVAEWDDKDIEAWMAVAAAEDDDVIDEKTYLLVAVCWTQQHEEEYPKHAAAVKKTCMASMVRAALEGDIHAIGILLDPDGE